MAKQAAELSLVGAINYHYGKFPPTKINYEKIAAPLADASAALARYDQMLKTMHNSEILLAPLRSQEAVISSRMEGTISTLEEVLRYEADHEEGEKAIAQHRVEAIEVFLYGQAMRDAQKQIESGQPVSEFLLRTVHRRLLDFGRGADKSPGEYKTAQNYLADSSKRRVLFIPISPPQLNAGMEELIDYIGDDRHQILLRTAFAHLEFEALHPFNDGNGRVGRMLITLMLWHYNVVSAPHFYISNYLEENRDQYIDLMREVSNSDDWTDWAIFFLRALESQANENLITAESMRQLYENMKDELRELLASQWSTAALDFLFSRPVFWNKVFTSKSGIPAATAHRFVRILLENNILTTLQPSAGSRSALYAFEPLLALVRD